MKTKFTPKTFKLIYHAILEKCEKTKGFENLGKGEALFGFGRFVDDPLNPNIKSIMTADMAVKDYLLKNKKDSINGKYLYDRVKDSENSKSSEVGIMGFYVGLYLTFLEFENVDALIENLRKKKTLTEKEVDEHYRLNGKSHMIRSKDVQRYRGYYFSFKNNEVKYFDLLIDPDNNTAQLTGLHDSILKGEKSTVKYNGKIEYLEENLGLDLRSEKNEGDKISLLVYHGKRSLDSQTYLRGIYMAISNRYYPFSGEMILTKVKDFGMEHPIHHETELVIKQYLYLERKGFYSPREYLLEHTDLQPKKRSIDNLKNLVGYYKAWSFSYYSRDNKSLIKGYQSKLAIFEDYSTEFYSAFGNEKGSEKDSLNIRFWVTEDLQNRKRASITVFSEEELMIKNHAIMDIPTDEERESDKEDYHYVRGVYCSLGTKTKDFLAAAVILERIDEDVYTEFSPRAFEHEKVSKEPAYLMLIAHYENTTAQQKPDFSKK